MAKQKKRKKTTYLDPKNDLTFRKIFGKHPHLLISFLNSLLPLEKDQHITEIEYLDSELIPELPGFKNTIVDVHCLDNHNRYFIVEMQMYWTSSFKQRMLFNTSKAYVKQLKRGDQYRDLKPVYGLSLVDDIFHNGKELKDTFYHHYRMVHKQITNEQIKGLELVFVELPKFKARNYRDKKLQTLWLRFLTEINEDTEKVSEDLTSNKEIKEALEQVHKDAFTEEELRYYEEYWDTVRVEKAAVEELKEKLAKSQKREQEAQKQREEAQKREKEERKQRETIQYNSAKELNKAGVPIKTIVEITGLPEDKIKKLTD